MVFLDGGKLSIDFGSPTSLTITAYRVACVRDHRHLGIELDLA